VHYILITKSITPTYVRPITGQILVTTQPAGAVHNAQLVQHNTGKLQHPLKQFRRFKEKIQQTKENIIKHK
jgi:hypothetical protein